MNSNLPNSISSGSNSAARVASKRRWASLLPPLLIAVAAFAAFGPALNNDFVDWDDELYLTGHENFHGLGWEQIRWMFTTTHGGPYQPFSWLTWAIDYSIWGMNPRGYHLTNMLLHSANAAAFYLVGAILLRLAVGPRSPRETFAVRAGAVAAALLFAVHPLRVESVAWATERRDVLSGLFYLLSILAYLRWYLRNQGPVSGWPAGAFVLFACALLSKGMSVTLPVVLLILDWYPLRREGSIRRAVLEKVPFLAASLVVGVVAVYGVQSVGALSHLTELSPIKRVVVACYSVCFYPLKTLCPINLSPFCEFPVNLDIMYWPYLLSVAAFAAGCWLLCRYWRRWPGVAAAWASHLVILGPVAGLLHAGPQLVADRYTYLSMMGPTLLAGGGIYRLWASGGRWIRRATVGVGTLVLVMVLATLTWRQTLIWRNPIVLWQRVLELNPNSWHANNNLGIHMAKLGRVDLAMDLYGRAINIKAGYANAHYNLAILLTALGRDDEAVANYEAALTIDPKYPLAYTNLGNIYLKRGQVAQAAEFYRQAVGLSPDDPASLSNLGSALTRLGHLDEAVSVLNHALEVKPRLLEARYNLGLALEQAGRIDEAVAAFRHCVDQAPDHLKSAESLGDILVAQGRFAEAVEPLRLVVALQPDLVQKRTNLGHVLTEAGRYPEALQVLRSAHRQDAEHLPTLLALARLEAASPVADTRNGAEALELAQRACQRTAYKSARALDILAAALAEVGRFAEASGAAARAAELARSGKNTGFAAQIEARRRLYLSEQPYRLPGPSAP